jgi:cobalamin transport system substrate-binding protein
LDFKMTRRCLLVTLLLATYISASEAPKRIICLSPDLTEILYGVGAFDRVVGVSNYDTYPAETNSLPRLGQLDSPNLEKLTGLHPDLVVINNAQAPFVEDTLKELGLRVLKTSNQSVQEVYAAMISIGHATGHEDGATRLVTATRDALNHVAKRTAGLPKSSVVLVIDRTPGTLRDMYTATDGSYLAELVAIAGGRMSLPPVATGYRKLDKEELLAVDPEIILDFVQGSKGRLAGNPIEPWREMPELKAVKTQKVYGVNEDFVPHASQRIVQTAELFARLIHPEKK